MKFKLIIVFLFVIVYSFAQDGAVHKGIYMIYENLTYDTKLRQKILSSDFNESYNADINTYPNIKLGYSLTAWGNLGASDWTVWGVDLGFGLNYGRSVMNALKPNQEYSTELNSTTSTDYSYDVYDAQSTQTYYPTVDFKKMLPNNQIFFNHYQPGNQCILNDYGLNMHFDAGTIWYVGAEIDAGVSHISFTDSRIQDQKVNSTGWYSNARLHTGISIPLPLVLESFLKLNLKAYAVFLGWSARHYKMDWSAGDKELKNFSTIQSNGSPLGFGFSLSILFNDDF
jgi:hypothetical protein